MMAYRGQNYVITLSLKIGSRRDEGSKSRSVRFTLKGGKPVVLE
jgi:hypothetical protein